MDAVTPAGLPQEPSFHDEVKLPATKCCRVASMCRCQVCNRAAVALVATGPRRVAL